MKQTIIAFIMVIFLITPAFAQSQFSKTIGRIENSLYGIEYSNQKDMTRLERIEKTVYGEASQGSVQSRLSKLSKDVAADVMGKEITPQKDTFAEDTTEYIHEEEQKADSSVDYPVVNKMEKVVYNKEYKHMDISQRLANLEKSTFKKTYNDDLNTRMERLKSAITVEIPKVAQEYDNIYSENFPSSSNYYSSKDNYYSSRGGSYYPQLDNDYSAKSNDLPDYIKSRSVFDDDIIAQRDLKAKINSIEKNVLKKTYSNDNVNNRLSRLESRVFNTVFTDDSEKARINRLASATKAQKTAKKYDSNSFSQKMSTVMQIGMMVLMVVAMVL